MEVHRAPGSGFQLVYRNVVIELIIRAWANMKLDRRTLPDNSPVRYEHECICALPALLKKKNESLITVKCIATVFPSPRDLVKSGMFAIYQCVHNAMNIDAVSIDYRQDKDALTCWVGLYQCTINTKDHSDSYANVVNSPDLATFLRDIHAMNELKVTIHTAFFWMVKECSGLSYQIQGRSLSLVKTTPIATDGGRPPRWNLIRDSAALYKVTGPKGGGALPPNTFPMDEYVVHYKANDFFADTTFFSH